MNFDSERLITSFFPRITRKRRIHTELASSISSNKRQRGTARQSRVNEDQQERGNTLDNGIISILNSPSVENTRQETSERHMSLLPSLNAKNTTSQTPKPNRPQSRTKHTIPSSSSLQTPPPTNGAAKRQRLMELTQVLPSSMSRKSLDLRIEKVLLPTPSTLGRSSLRHNGYSGNERSRVNQGQVLLSPTRPKRSDPSLRASVPVSIPSSQSQLMAIAYCEDKHPLIRASTALPLKKQLLQYEVQPSPNRIILNRRDEGDSVSHDGQMFISSSQSQLLHTLDEHDHSQPRLFASNPEFDIIPSSQSQEKELRILNNLGEGHQSKRSRKQAMPKRTLSDELFSVSILQTGWSDCDQDLEQPIKGTADISCVANQGDDSVTESESEPETKKDSYYRGHCLTPMQPHPNGFLRLSNADIASLNEDSEQKDSRNSQQRSQALLSTDQSSSISSLPSAVKEFQSMFGSDDESYPADFPKSLR